VGQHRDLKKSGSMVPLQSAPPSPRTIASKNYTALKQTATFRMSLSELSDTQCHYNWHRCLSTAVVDSYLVTLIDFKDKIHTDVRVFDYFHTVRNCVPSAERSLSLWH